MICSPETLRVDLVNIFCARRACREPSVLNGNFQPTNWRRCDSPFVGLCSNPPLLSLMVKRHYRFSIRVNPYSKYLITALRSMADLLTRQYNEALGINEFLPRGLNESSA